MILVERECIYRIKNFLDKINYKFIYKFVAADKYRNSPFLETNLVKDNKTIHERYKIIIEGFYFNLPIEVEKFVYYYGEEILAYLQQILYIKVNENVITFLGYRLAVIEDTYVVITNESVSQISKKDKVYIGDDTFELIKYLDKRRGGKVLDICSGTGVLGLVMCSYASKVIAVEKDNNAYQLCKFNVLLNGYEDVMEIRRGDLYDVIRDNERFDYIVTNPPYVAVPKTISFPLCAEGGESGLDIINRILSDSNKYLFDSGKVIMILEGIGDEKKPFFLDYINRIKGQKWLSLIARRNSKFQSEIYGKVSHKRNDKQSCIEYKEIWEEFYRKNNVSFIYYMVFVLTNNKTDKLDVLECYNPYGTDTVIKVKENVTLNKYGDKYVIHGPDQQQLFISKSLYELLQNKKDEVSLKCISNFSGEEIELLFFQLYALEKAGMLERVR